MNLDKIWEYKLRRAFTAWDRSTAYGCNLRNEPYDAKKQEELRVSWFNLIEEHNQYCVQQNLEPLKIQHPSQEER